jgi:hypothetical protein
MEEESMRAAPDTQTRALRTPRAAGAAGVLSALLLATVLVLVYTTLPAAPSAGAAGWPQTPSGRQALQTALDLLPFAGIFFLWFMGAVRDFVGGAEDKFFATLFLGSGLLFTAAILAVGAVAGGLLAIAASSPADGQQLGRYGHAMLSLLIDYAMRMAAVFTLSTTTIGRGLRIFPRWLAWVGYLATLALLFVAGAVPLAELAFPIWLLLVSAHILAASFRTPSPDHHPAASTNSGL